MQLCLHLIQAPVQRPEEAGLFTQGTPTLPCMWHGRHKGDPPRPLFPHWRSYNMSAWRSLVRSKKIHRNKKMLTPESQTACIPSSGRLPNQSHLYPRLWRGALLYLFLQDNLSGLNNWLTFLSPWLTYSLKGGITSYSFLYNPTLRTITRMWKSQNVYLCTG